MSAQLETGLDEGIEHEQRVAPVAEVGPHRRHLGRQQTHLRPGDDQHRAAGERVAAAQQRDLLDGVVHRFERVAGLGHPMPFVQHVPGAQAMTVAGRPLEVVVRFQAERIRLSVAVEETDALDGGLGHAKDAVGDVDLTATVDLQASAFTLHDGRASEVDAEHPGLRRLEHGVEELDRHATRLARDQLIELDGLPHHRVVEEHDVNRPLQPLQHRDRRW
jgi:hypothetical protein